MIQHPLPPFEHRRTLRHSWLLLTRRRGLVWLTFLYIFCLGSFWVWSILPLDKLLLGLEQGGSSLSLLGYVLPILLWWSLTQLLDLRLTQTTLGMIKTGDRSYRLPWKEALRRWLPYMGLALVLQLVFLVGGSLMLVPGAYLLLRFSFAPSLSVDQGLGVWAALRASWRLTEGHFYLQLAALGLALGLSFLASSFVLGIYIAYPVLRLYFAQLYYYLRAEELPSEEYRAQA